VTATTLHGVITQKSTTRILTVVKTSNVTIFYVLKITNMATARNFVIIFDRCNVFYVYSNVRGCIQKFLD
jgi:hypothetical protein